MDSEKKYVDVILPLPLMQNFTYLVPEELYNSVKIGVRVIVQFGNRKLYSALIKRIHSNEPAYETKTIEAVLDVDPIVHSNQFVFWEWLSNYYICSEGEVMKAALPSGLKLESQTQVHYNEEWEACDTLGASEEAIFQFIYNQKSTTIQQINTFSKRLNALPIVKSLLEKGAIQIEEKVSESFKPKIEMHIAISATINTDQQIEDALNSCKRAQKQHKLLIDLIEELCYFSSEKKLTIAKKEFIEKYYASETALKALIDKGVIEVIHKEINRLADYSQNSDYQKVLNIYQQQALTEIKHQFNTKNVILLQGITSSGKTEIYIQLIKEQIEAGKQVLYLLPEIALTTQIITRLSSIFGNKVGVYHSKYSDSERVEIWNKVLGFSSSNQNGSNTYQLVLGARSAMLLPFSNLGLIIVDEEHETSFKQFDPSPRYNARDSSVILASQSNAKVLMGTATPSFETYSNTLSGKYGLVKLTKRFNDIALPEIVVADIIDAYKRKLIVSNFTPELIAAIKTALDNKQQVILFQNRRGFSPFVQCYSCGWIPRCKNCDVSLTYHKNNNALQCHYCSYKTTLPSTCPQCKCNDVRTKGFGTEKIEDDLKQLFPEAVVDRMDLDTTRTKRGFEKIIEKFASGKVDILIGTQMVTKGLDFERVSVVGILNADNLLNFPDFRSFERSYQLMVQVSGRAGRKGNQGKVILQTSSPNHPVIHDVITNNFENMYKGLIEERRFFKYPPWYRLINITVKHTNIDKVKKASRQLALELQTKLAERVLGPEFPLISRLQLNYQMMIRLKLEKSLSLTDTRIFILNSIDKIKRLENNSNIQIIIDVDPQ